MKFAELAGSLGVPARQVRYMIAEGIMPGASDLGRSADGFSEEHLRLGRAYLRLQEQGFPPSAIKRLMAGGFSVPLVERHPVTLSVDPSVDPGTIDVEAVLADIAAALRNYVNPTQE